MRCTTTTTRSAAAATAMMIIALLLCAVSLPAAPPATAPRASPTTLHVGQRVNRTMYLAPGGEYALTFSVDLKAVGASHDSDQSQWRLVHVASGRDAANGVAPRVNLHWGALTPDGRFGVLRGNSAGPPPKPGLPATVVEYCAVWDFRAAPAPKELYRLDDTYRTQDAAIAADGALLLTVDARRAGGPRAADAADADEGRIVLNLRESRAGEILRTAGKADDVGDARHVAMTPDARIAVTGGSSSDETVRVWDLSTMRPLHVMRGHTDALVAVAVTPNARYAASVDRGGGIRVWDVAAGTQVRAFKLPSGEVRAVALSRDGRRMLTSHANQRYIPDKQASVAVRLWDVEAATSQVLGDWRVERGGLAFREDGAGVTKAVIAASPRTIHTVDLPPIRRTANATPEPALTLRPLPGDPTTRPVAPATRAILGAARTIHYIRHPRAGKVHPLKVGAVGWNALDGPDGFALAAVQGGPETFVASWDVASGQEVARVKLATPSPASWPVAISRDATRVYSFQHAGGMEAIVWRADSGEIVARHRGRLKTLHALAVARDGVTVATGGPTDAEQPQDERPADAFDIVLWDARTGHDIATLKGDARTIAALAFAPDGTRLVSGSDEPPVPDHIGAPAPRERTIPALRLWDIKTANATASFRGPLNVKALSFTRDGKRVIACGQGEGGWDYVWVLDGGTLKPTASAKVTHSSLTALAVSPDGTRLLTGGSDSNVRVWDVPTLSELHRFDAHAARIRCITFSPDGRRAVSGDEAGGVAIWELPPPATNR